MIEFTRAERALLEWLLKRSKYWDEITATILETPGRHESEYLIAHAIRSDLNGAMMKEVMIPSVWNALVISALADVDFYKLARVLVERSRSG